MDWSPLFEEEIRQLLHGAEKHLSLKEQRFWELVRTPPRLWQCPPWSDEDGGFWAVGLIGASVIWYNPIEEGFNLSPFSNYGTIDDYRCNQDPLAQTLRALLCQLEQGVKPGYSGPPEPL